MALVLGLAYAVLRYVVLGPVPASEIPLFIANKAISAIRRDWQKPCRGTTI